MAKLSRPRYGSIQFWPRKRAARALPRINWEVIKGEGLMGALAYKVGMGTAFVRDKTDKSLTVNKKIVLPVTILELPKMKIFSVRFYKKGQIIKEVIVSQDKELKRVVKVPKQLNPLTEKEGYDELRVLVYPVMKMMFKKTPILVEMRVRGANALAFVKDHVGKEIRTSDILAWDLVDVRGLTRGKGLVGPVKRFGISLKNHKSEKGVRRPGSLGPWHPAHVSFRVPMAGQLGMFSRTHYNLKVLGKGTVGERGIGPQTGFKHYGTVGGDFVLLSGSVQGPPKREIVITPAQRPTRKQMKRKYELMEIKL